jgi:tripartite-type tricarboxylate transporter receptor subunit TctC
MILGAIAAGLTALLSCSAIAQSSTPAGADTYPTRSIRLLVPFGPGGVGDITSRVVAQKMSEAMGQQVVIENRPSAGGIVAMELAAKANPDGYTLMGLSNANAISAAMFNALPYDTVNDFAMVSTLGAFSLVVLVAQDSSIRSLGDLISQAKAAPGKLNIGTVNVGTTQYLAAELFKSMAGLDLVTVPHGNTAAVMGALRSNGVQAAFEFLPPTLGQIRAGTVKALAVTPRKRFAQLPDVPTLDEGGVPGYEVSSWNGVAVPAKTPRRIIDRLNKEIHAAVNSPQVLQRFQDLGVEPNASTPEAAQKYLISEIAKWNALIDEAKIQRQ